jgi:predicted RND superfamily exporter protein
MRRLDGVLAVAAPRYLSDDTWQIDIIAAEPPYSASTQDLVTRLSALETRRPLFVGGDAAAFHDERGAIGSHLPLAVALLAIATLVILFLLSGSLVAPLLSLLMTGLTLAATSAR